MLIVSKFHDYYDSAATYGIDRKVVYKRVQKEVKFNKRLHHTMYSYKGSSLYDIKRAIVGVAGEIYPMVYVENCMNNDVFYFYSYKEFEAFLNKTDTYSKGSYKFYKRKDFEAFFDKKHRSFITQYDVDLNVTKQIFIDHKVPVFLMTHENVLLNANLSDIKFGRVMPATTAFQAIQSYIESMTPREKISEVSDKVKIQQRGFDKKYGFRKRPEARWKKEERKKKK